MKHPTRYMRDGTATTRRVHGVQRTPCDDTSHLACFVPVMSWAGDPVPRPRPDWHIAVLNTAGKIMMTGPLVGRETRQFEAGLIRRARDAFAKET